MKSQISRRQMLKESIRAMVLGTVGVSLASAATSQTIGQNPVGAISGQADSAAIGAEILKDGGNAVDAAVAAALASCIATPAHCGIGGYGGHITIAMARQRKVTCIDFNSAAPAAARPDMYALDSNGHVHSQANLYGWRAIG